MQLEHILQAHGLLGRGGGKSKDNIPPPPITNLQATVVGQTIKLTWTNPNDSDFIGLMIRGKNGSYPSGPNDGDTVFNKNIEEGGTITTEYTDSDITLGTRKYYRAFPYDWDKNYQTDTGQQVNAIVKITQSKPSAPTMVSRTSTSITLNSISGCEYRIGSGNWQDSTTFSGLSIATQYTFYARKKETETHYASEISNGTNITTDKGTQTAPAAPNVDIIAFDNVVVTGAAGTEVRIGSGAWYDSPKTFTDLTAETNYTAYARKKETNTHYASSISLGKSFTTPPEADDPSGSPGNKDLIAGTMQEGFFGEVAAADFINGADLASAVGISQGTLQNSTESWLKFAYKGKILFRPKKAIRHSISWDAINNAKCVYGDPGDTTVVIGGLTYKVRLMRGGKPDNNPKVLSSAYDGAFNHESEWNRLMCQIHEQAINKGWAYPSNIESDIGILAHNLGTGANGMYNDADLALVSVDGRFVWCQEIVNSASLRLFRGYYGVSSSGYSSSSDTATTRGWCPVLELVA